MSYPIDPELSPWVAMLPRPDFADPVAARREARTPLARLAPPPRDGLTVADRTVPGAAGAPDVPVRVYRPRHGTAPLPAVLQIHGGGFITGDLDLEHPAAARVSAEVGAVVVTVDYRLAPEHPYPAALDDCYAALAWLTGSGAGLGVDPGRVAVYGESAGGGLAAALALRARDRRGPPLALQYLGIPELDDRLDTPSMRAYVDTPVMRRRDAVLSWAHYLGTAMRPGGADVPPYAAPARAGDLRGLPPAYVTVCQFDPLRDEGIEYARRLSEAGVPVELHLYPATFHGCGDIDGAVTRRMHADGIDALRRALSPVGAPPRVVVRRDGGPG